jgi:phosphoribulokinase
MSSRPIMIAVGGDSGTGKATLSRGLEVIFGAARSARICLDDYHALDRAQRKAVGISAVDPRANNFAAMEEDLWALREGRTIDKPVYDHARGTFGAVERVEAKEIVIVHGLFPLYTRALRSLFDVTVWLDPEPEIRTAWKIQRDTIARGHREADVRAEIDRRAAGVAKFIAPQARYADLTLTFHRPPDWQANADQARLSARIRKGGRFRPLDYSEFESESTSIRQMQTGAGGYPETVIELDGRIEPAIADAVHGRIWSHLGMQGHPRPSQLGEFRDARDERRTSATLALSQLLIARRVVLIEHELLEMIT